MKHITLIILLCCISNSLLAKKPPRERAENAKIVLGKLAQIFGQIGNIIEDPHNPDNVGDCISNMVDKFIEITVHAVHNKNIQPTNGYAILEQLQELCKNFDQNILDTIATKKSRLPLL